MYLLLYVNDMLIASQDKSLINKLKLQLSKELDMKDLGTTKKILGMEIKKDHQAGKLFLSQKKYILNVLDWLNVIKYKLFLLLLLHILNYHMIFVQKRRRRLNTY